MNNCTSCGSPIPDGQGKSCSMCYGDPEHGTDGYYNAYLDQEIRRAQDEEERRQHWDGEWLQDD